MKISKKPFFSSFIATIASGKCAEVVVTFEIFKEVVEDLSENIGDILLVNRIQMRLSRGKTQIVFNS